MLKSVACFVSRTERVGAGLDAGLAAKAGGEVRADAAMMCATCNQKPKRRLAAIDASLAKLELESPSLFLSKSLDRFPEESHSCG